MVDELYYEDIDETFAVVADTNERYYASSFGYVYDTKLDRIVPTRTTYRGYLDCKINFNDKRRTINLHRVIAMAFLGKSQLTVNHKDGNKFNNAIDNLEYMTVQEQNIHRSSVLHRGNQIPIICEETGKVYHSANEAAKDLGLKDSSHISAVINNKYGFKSVYGYHFRKL